MRSVVAYQKLCKKPADPLLFLRNIDSCDATPQTTLMQNSTCKPKYGMDQQNLT